MASKKEAWGVEVGAQAIKVMKLVRTPGGIALDDFDVLPFKNVLTTPELNVEEAIRVNLDALIQKHDLSGANVCISVPGHMAFARFAKLPPIEASKVKSIVAYEAQQQIPFPIDQVEWDYQVFAQDDAPDIEVGIFAITKERVAHFLSNYRSVGMKVDVLTLSPVAVYNAFAHENAGGGGHGDGTVYLDIGTVSTDIIVVEDGGIWLRTLPLGGNHFTQALMNQFKISFAKAEKLKLEAGTSKYAKQIYQAMRGVFNDLVTEIQRSLGFYTSLNRDSELTRIVGVGSTWKLPGLQKYLKQNLQMKVVRPDGYTQLQVEDRRAAEFSSIAVNMATAYGLALQGLGESAVDANILPQSVLRQRMWKAKQPWIGAAAACVLVAGGIGPARQFLAGNAFDSAWKAASPGIQGTVSKARQFKGEYDSVQTTDPRPAIRNYRRAFDYSDMAPKLLSDVSAAMATIQPNAELAGLNWNNPSDVERIAAVPRSKRDQVWVTHISTEYKPPSAPVYSEDAAPSPSPGAEEAEFGGNAPGFSEAPLGAASASLTPVPFPMVSAPDPDIVVDDGTQTPDAQDPATPTSQPVVQPNDPRPRIIVTVQGETTMASDALASHLQQDVVGWMKDNAIRSDRPYIIVPELTQRSYSRRGVSQDAGAGTQGGGQSDLSPTPSPKPKSDQPGLTGPGLIQPGGGRDLPGSSRDGATQSIEIKTPEGWYARLGNSANAGFSKDALLPKRPLSNEPKSEDYLFTFRFEVVLLNPDDARASILASEQTPATGEPAAATPSTTQEDPS